MAADSTSIKVACRIRPLNSKEKTSGSQFIFNFPNDTCVALGNKFYNFDRVFQPNSTQLELYELTALPLVKDVLCGYNSTIFAYGQTASGKTHTMEGELDDPELQGITPRIVNEIFEQIYAMDTNLEFQIKVSYFELYMERIRDLLDYTKVNLPIHENKKKVPYVKGVTERFVTMPEEVMAIIEEGKAARHVAVTNMNAHSSRSHAIFLISIRQENKETHHTLTGKLFLVDLAGSEKVEKTNAQGLTLEEAKGINKSLLALSNVISSLSEGTRSHIPYRDSKLTRVLQESLGGNARTTLIICCSPSSYNESESKSTLQFGDRAKTIKNKVEVNVELTADEWRKRYEKQKDECEHLKQLMAVYVTELSKWRKGDSVPAGEQSSLKSFKPSPSKPTKTSGPRTSTTSTTSTTSLSSSASLGLVTNMEEENAKLYQQLDNKDDDINKYSKLVEELNMKLKDTEERMTVNEQDSNILTEKLFEAEQQISRSHEEVQEVMEALEELALSYDGKDKIIETLETEKQSLTKELDMLQSKIFSNEKGLQSLNEKLDTEKRRHKNSLVLLFKELNEMGSVLGSQSSDMIQVFETNANLTEEDFTRARIQLSNMRVEARSVTEQRNILEKAERAAKTEAESAMREVNVLRMRLSQLESRSNDLRADLSCVNTQKNDLETSLDQLQEQLSSAKEEERILTDSVNGQKQVMMEDTLTKYQDTHQKEIDSLKTEIINKQQQLGQLQEQCQRQIILEKTLRNDIIRLESQQHEYSLLSQRLSIKEKMEHEYNGVTETVKSELSQLDTLKQVLYKKVLNRVQAKKDKIESPEKGEAKFFEKNLEELSRAHKKTLSSYSELQREVLKYRTSIEAKSHRISELELILMETKEAADKEYKRLHEEKEHMKIAFFEKLRDREKKYLYQKQGPSIVRPVVRPRDMETMAQTSSRDALLAFAGVHRINETRRSSLLTESKDTNQPQTNTSDQSQTNTSDQSQTNTSDQSQSQTNTSA